MGWWQALSRFGLPFLHTKSRVGKKIKNKGSATRAGFGGMGCDEKVVEDPAELRVQGSFDSAMPSLREGTATLRMTGCLERRGGQAADKSVRPTRASA